MSLPVTVGDETGVDGGAALADGRARGPAAGWPQPLTMMAALAAVLVARLLYLARYGWDIGWMNLAYLRHARLLAVTHADPAEEQPLGSLALLGARRCGLSALQANEVVYLVAHLVLAAGAIGIAQFVWPAATRRRRAILVATLALLPLLASQSGRNNLGVTLAAALTAAALACAAVAATRGRAPWMLAAACAGAALAFALAGRRMAGVRAPRRAGGALAIGALGGLVAVGAIHRALGGGAAAPGATYAFYTFFDGLPLLMHFELPGTEYGRYRASVGYFGGYETNHGSLAQALLHHPGWAFLRVLTKPVDMLLVLLWVYALTPVGLALAALGATRLGPPRSWGRWGRGWLLASYVLPLGMLLVPQQNPAYYVGIAVPLVLAVTLGADALAERLAPRTARALGGLAIAGALGLIVFAGKLSVTNSRALNAAASYLETRCAAGCLTTVLPQSLRDQAWIVTDAGAPFPPHDHRSERVVFGGLSGIDPAGYDFCTRVERARAAGFKGPVLVVDPRIQTFKVFDPDFDPEVRYQGTFDRASLVEERRFRSGPDELIVSVLPEGARCR